MKLPKDLLTRILLKLLNVNQIMIESLKYKSR